MKACKWGGCNGEVPDDGGTCNRCGHITVAERHLSKTHEIKTWPDPFWHVLEGRKNHEVRKFDRDYRVGDFLVLKEFYPHTECNGSGLIPDNNDRTACCPEPHGEYSGRILKVRISYITSPGRFGLPKDIGVLSIQRLPPDD